MFFSCFYRPWAPQSYYKFVFHLLTHTCVSVLINCWLSMKVVTLTLCPAIKILDEAMTPTPSVRSMRRRTLMSSSTHGGSTPEFLISTAIVLCCLFRFYISSINSHKPRVQDFGGKWRICCFFDGNMINIFYEARVQELLISFLDVVLLPSWGSFSTTFLKNFGKGESLLYNCIS